VELQGCTAHRTVGGGACGMYGTDEKCLRSFDREIKGKNVSSKEKRIDRILILK
jgi:hypothetical protein